MGRRAFQKSLAMIFGKERWVGTVVGTLYVGRGLRSLGWAGRSGTTELGASVATIQRTDVSGSSLIPQAACSQ